MTLQKDFKITIEYYLYAGTSIPKICDTQEMPFYNIVQLHTEELPKC
jgi:hypothetical protein